jgi:hypothetical protein
MEATVSDEEMAELERKSPEWMAAVRAAMAAMKLHNDLGGALDSLAALNGACISAAADHHQVELL